MVAVLVVLALLALVLGILAYVRIRQSDARSAAAYHRAIEHLGQLGGEDRTGASPLAAGHHVRVVEQVRVIHEVPVPEQRAAMVEHAASASSYQPPPGPPPSDPPTLPGVDPQHPRLVFIDDAIGPGGTPDSEPATVAQPPSRHRLRAKAVLATTAALVLASGAAAATLWVLRSPPDNGQISRAEPTASRSPTHRQPREAQPERRATSTKRSGPPSTQPTSGSISPTSTSPPTTATAASTTTTVTAPPPQPGSPTAGAGGPQGGQNASGAPELTSVSPPSGQAGQTVTLTGANLYSPSGPMSVHFGPAAASFSCPSQTTCEAMVPQRPPGPASVPVTVTTGAGTSNAVTFTYS